jgi:uncharacterized protein involved in outer membrane biogenesis
MKIKPWLIGFALLILVLLIVPLLIPMGSYIKQLEQVASKKLGAPVSIKAIHLAVLPSPRANLSGISIGKDAEIQVAEVAAVLDVTTLFKPVRVLSKLNVDKPILKKSAIDLLMPLLAQKSEGPPPIAIRRITVNDAKLEWPGIPLPPFDANLAMSDDVKLQQATIKSTDDKLTIEATPKGVGYAASINAQEWTLPVGPPLKLDKVEAYLVYAGQTLDVPSVDVALYGGKLHASAHLDWEKNWQLGGKFKTDAIELQDASKLFTKGIWVSGRIAGNGTLNSTAKAPDQLADKLVMDYTFNVNKGVLHGMDLAKAASLFIKQGGKGGETEFDQLSGKVHTTGKQIELRDMNVQSGLLAANGQVKVTPAKVLDGLVNVELKKGLALVTVPLKVSGTVDAPEIMPTKAAIAGAAAGTALLGPMGTSMGMKAGSALDKLFGGSKK